MRSLYPLVLFTSSLALFNPSAGARGPDDVVSHTFAADGVSGTVAIDPERALEYFRDEVGIDVGKLRRHPELFSAAAVGDYTFPAGSGAEGTLSWNLTGKQQRGGSSVAADEHLTCDDCALMCATMSWLPLGWIT
ncbi:hypothetical protein F4804DRAFT_353182 [Jackrogersella minutella]|nr:hypothetical protein F4804DRAFT_353182 [Jackrogersella minutella]